MERVVELLRQVDVALEGLVDQRRADHHSADLEAGGHSTFAPLKRIGGTARDVRSRAGPSAADGAGREPLRRRRVDGHPRREDHLGPLQMRGRGFVRFAIAFVVLTEEAMLRDADFEIEARWRVADVRARLRLETGIELELVAIFERIGLGLEALPVCIAQIGEAFAVEVAGMLEGGGVESGDVRLPGAASRVADERDIERFGIV